MNDLFSERIAFGLERQKRESLAGERASCFLVAGIDIDHVLTLSPEVRRVISRKLRRLLERERLKGTRGHWSYDLNRHIALKRAYDSLSVGIGVSD